MKDKNLGELIDEALKPRKERFFGPNAWPVLIQFSVGLAVMFAVSYLFGGYDGWFRHYIANPIVCSVLTCTGG